jgi:glyoxylase-like metal-dependent hydrolase (beta-lactamase superfamily II)
MEQQSHQVREVANRGWDARLRVFHAGGVENVDTCVLCTTRYLVFIDTMTTPEMAAAILEHVLPSLSGRQALVINTHVDYDHAWGNAVFASPSGACPAPIIAHHAARARMRSGEVAATLREKQRQDAQLANVRLVEPTIVCDDGLLIDGGDLTLQLVYTPGHTQDHMAVWIPELRTVLAGDAAEHPWPYVGARSNLSTLRQSLRKLVALQPDVVIPCHGGTTDPGLLTRNLSYFDTLESQARALISQGSLPGNWREREDLDTLIGYPFDRALRDQGAEPAATDDFYRACHRNAIIATLTLLS